MTKSVECQAIKPVAGANVQKRQNDVDGAIAEHSALTQSKLQATRLTRFAPKYRNVPMPTTTVECKDKANSDSVKSLPVCQKTLQPKASVVHTKSQIIPTRTIASPSVKQQDYSSANADISSTDFGSIGVGSSAIENDRQLQHLCKSGSRENEECRLGLLDSLSKMLGFSTLVHSPNKHLADTEQSRQLKVRLSMDDPLLDEMHRCAHRLFVSGCSISELRTAGVQAAHLCEMGVSYEDWSQKCNLGVRDLVFLNATWGQIVAMGFLPRHITTDRDKSGPVVLSQLPLLVTMDKLERTLGLTVDEAVFELSFSTADFGVLGENMSTLMRKGFNRTHVTHMSEPPYNFEEALAASPSDLHFLFACQQETTKVQTTNFSAQSTGQPLREKAHERTKPQALLSDRAYLERQCRNKVQQKSNQTSNNKAFCFS